MKLVDILARELKVWPDQYYQIYQDSEGHLIGSLSDGDLEDCDSEGLPFDPVTIAWDGSGSVIDRAQWQDAVDALKAHSAPAWIGVGLPTVGTVCQVQHPDKPGTWCKCTILAWDSECAVFSADAHYPFTYDGSCHPENFKPIRMPEQIAAEERDKAIEDLYFTINWNEGRETWPIISSGRKADYAKAIDAGYRKLEIVEG